MTQNTHPKSELILVCPFCESLLSRVSNSQVVWVTDDVSKIAAIRQASQTFNIDIKCFWVRFNGNLSDLAMEDTSDIRIALEVKGMGRVVSCKRQFDWLKSQNIRLYLPLQTHEQASDLRIISSLGFQTCAMFPDNKDAIIDWEAVLDLAIYALYSKVNHGDIDPFSYLKRNYDGRYSVDYSRIYFDDPAIFLQVDATGRLGYRRHDFETGQYLDCPVENFRSVSKTLEYQQALTSYRQAFLQPTICGKCEAWRVCLGKFNGQECSPYCRDMFLEAMQSAKQEKTIENQRKSIWPQF